MDTYIHHRFMEEIIVPLSALDPNYGIYLGEEEGKDKAETDRGGYL